MNNTKKEIEEFAKKDGFVCLIDGIEDPYNFAYSMISLIFISE